MPLQTRPPWRIYWSMIFPSFRFCARQIWRILSTRSARIVSRSVLSSGIGC